MYPDFDTRLKHFTDWICNAQRDLRQKIREDKKSKEEREDVEKESQEDKLRNKIKHLGEKIDLEIKIIEHRESSFLEDLDRNIFNISKLRTELIDLFSEVSNIFGPRFEDEFSAYYLSQKERLTQILNYLFTASRKARKKDVQNKRDLEIRENTEKIAIFDGVYANIREKLQKFEEKCSVDFSNLEGTILKLSKKSHLLDSDFNDILNWITDLVKATHRDYPHAENVLGVIKKEKERMKNLLNSYKETLVVEVEERDLTERKIKDTAVLGLTLRKFAGYKWIITPLGQNSRD